VPTQTRRPMFVQQELSAAIDLLHPWRSRCDDTDVGESIVETGGNIAMSTSANMKSRFRAGAKLCSGLIMVLLVIGALGPASWTPRTTLGWQADHFVGYFAITLLVCFAWPRPIIVAAILTATAFVLEALQAFTPDRTANLVAALSGAGGVLAAALIAELAIRAWRRNASSIR
jgi:VanZ family protein